jgi:hypothetical protein
MGSIVSGLLGGGQKAPSGPSAAELEAQRKADAAEQEQRDARSRKQSRENAARRREAMRRAGIASTLAAGGSSGVAGSAVTASEGLKTKLGQ